MVPMAAGCTIRYVKPKHSFTKLVKTEKTCFIKQARRRRYFLADDNKVIILMIFTEMKSQVVSMQIPEC